MYAKGKFRSACYNSEKSRPQNTNTCIKTGWASSHEVAVPKPRGTKAALHAVALCRIRQEETRHDALCSVQGGGGGACALLQYMRLTTTYGGPPATVPGPPLPPWVTCPAHVTRPDLNRHSAQVQELMKRQKEGGRTQILSGRQYRGVEARRSR